MSEEILVVEDGTLTKFEADEHVRVARIQNSPARAIDFDWIGSMLKKFHGIQKRVEIPSRATVIMSEAFTGGLPIEQVIIPASVTSMMFASLRFIISTCSQEKKTGRRFSKKSTETGRMRKQSRHRKKKREVCSGEGEIQNVHFARYLLEAAIREDIQAGKKPFAIIGSLGTTNAL